MTVHIVPTRTEGDLRFEFKVDDEAEVAKAMERFNSLVKEGRAPVTISKNGEPATVVRQFDPNVDVSFLPAIAGG